MTKRTPELIAAEYVQYMKTTRVRFSNRGHDLWQELLALVGSLEAGIYLHQAEQTWKLMNPTPDVHQQMKKAFFDSF